MKVLELVARNQRLREAQREFLAALEAATARALADNNPGEMRSLAEQLHDIHLSVKSKLDDLQGKLNAKVFGRN